MATKAGYRISDPNELKTLKEGDIARVGKDIYRRDLTKEQEAMKTYKGQRGTAEADMTFNQSVYSPTIPKPDNIDASPIANEIVENPPTPNLPDMVSDAIQNAFVESSTANLETQRKNLMTVYNSQKTDYQKQIDELNKQVEEDRAKQKELIDKASPENLPFAEEISSITADRLKAAKTASATLEGNFLANQNSIKEVETILTKANTDIKAAENQPGLRSAKAYNVAQVRADGIARVGVIQAVMSARDGQINMAQSMIDDAYASVNSAKTDALNYYSALIDFYDTAGKETKIASLTSDEKNVIKNQISLLESQMEESSKVKDAISETILQDPNMVEQAGIKLTDTMEQIQTKLAKWQQTYGGVSELMNDYPDAGIRMTDTLQQAEVKLKNSRTYQDKVRGPVGSGSSGSGTGGEMSDLAKAVMAGTIRLQDITPTQRASIAPELMKAGYITPNKLTPAQQDDLSQMKTVNDLIDDILAYNGDGKLEGIGAFGQGSLSSLLAQAGFGSEEGKSVRALIGNIKGTIAKLRGGTSFTTNEEKLLNTYTPSINDNPSVAINKLGLLKDFINTKNQNLLLSASQGETIKEEEKITDIKSKYNISY